MKPVLTVQQRLRLMCSEANLDYDEVIRDWDAFSFAYHREEMLRAKARLLERGVQVPS